MKNEKSQERRAKKKEETITVISWAWRRLSGIQAGNVYRVDVAQAFVEFSVKDYQFK